VFVAGVTDGPGAGAGLLAGLGFGPASTSPVTQPGWLWTEAVYNVDVGANDEYRASLVVDETGAFSYAYRFSRDGGVRWLYCDLSGTSGMDPYDPTRGGALAVGE
jgi:hypothetical protein